MSFVIVLIFSLLLNAVLYKKEGTKCSQYMSLLQGYLLKHLFQWCSFNKNALSRRIIFDHWSQEGNFVTPAPKIGKF